MVYQAPAFRGVWLVCFLWCGLKGKMRLGDAHPYLGVFYLYKFIANNGYKYDVDACWRFPNSQGRATIRVSAPASDTCHLVATESRPRCILIAEPCERKTHMEILTVLFWATVGSVLSLIGGIILVTNHQLRAKAIDYGLPFGAGALLAAAFLGVLPEAIESSGVDQALIFALGGFLGFFILERFLGWFHHHGHHEHSHHSAATRSKAQQTLVIVGDTLHNAIDGIAIGAAFLVNPAAGIGTAIAVAAHELPQELGDFGILLGRGMKPRNVVLVNLLSALATVVTALTTYLLGSVYQINPAPLLAVAAGFFVYIAASDIIPEIHDQPRREANLQAIILFVGVILIALVLWSMPHGHHRDQTTVCLPESTLAMMGAPAPGTSLPPACESNHSDH